MATDNASETAAPPAPCRDDAGEEGATLVLPPGAASGSAAGGASGNNGAPSGGTPDAAPDERTQLLPPHAEGGVTQPPLDDAADEGTQLLPRAGVAEVHPPLEEAEEERTQVLPRAAVAAARPPLEEAEEERTQVLPRADGMRGAIPPAPWRQEPGGQTRGHPGNQQEEMPAAGRAGAAAAQDHGDALESGYMLLWYRIEGVLGQGSFGITYQAYDTRLQSRVAIKEFLPLFLASRSRDDHHTVRPKSPNQTDAFHRFRSRFIDEARLLAKFRHPNLVRVLTFFEEGNTAYMAMDYEAGEDLDTLLEREAPLPEERVRALLLPLLGGVAALHREGFIHRDIKSNNIVVREKDGLPVLLDFGSARPLGRGEARQAMTMMFTPNFAPLEQYFSDSSHQGPWTDIYALGAVFYHAITGHKPVNAFTRNQELLEKGADPNPPAREEGKGRYSEGLLAAIDWALEMDYRQRPQSVAQWQASLAGHAPQRAGETFPAKPVQPQAPPPAPAPAPLAEQATPAPPPQPAPRGSGSRLVWAALLLGVVATGLGGYALLQRGDEPLARQAETVGQTARDLRTEQAPRPVPGGAPLPPDNPLADAPMAKAPPFATAAVAPPSPDGRSTRQEDNAATAIPSGLPAPYQTPMGERDNPARLTIHSPPIVARSPTPGTTAPLSGRPEGSPSRNGEEMPPVVMAVVAPTQADHATAVVPWQVQLATSHKARNNVYVDGEAVRFEVTIGQNGYLYLFHLDAQDHVTLLYPPPGSTLVRHEASHPFQWPNADTPFEMRAAPPYGREWVWSVVSNGPLAFPGPEQALWNQSSAFKEHIRELGRQGGGFAEDEVLLEIRPPP